MPVWGVRCVYAGVPYSCTPVCVRKPCCSVTLYCVVSSTSINAAIRQKRRRLLLNLVAIFTRQDFVRMLLSGKNLSHSLLVIHILYCCHTSPPLLSKLQSLSCSTRYTMQSLFLACAVLIIVCDAVVLLAAHFAQ